MIIFSGFPRFDNMYLFICIIADIRLQKLENTKYSQRRSFEIMLFFWPTLCFINKGFGDLMGSFYFGNDKIHSITSTKDHVLRIEMTDALGDQGYAEYSNFR